MSCVSWRDCLGCCNRKRIGQDPGAQHGKSGVGDNKTMSAESIDGDTLQRKFIAAVEKLQVSNATLLHENEKLKAEVKQLKEAANREVLLGRGGFSNSSSAMSGPTSGIISRKKTSQAMVLEEEGDEDDSDEDEKDSR